MIYNNVVLTVNNESDVKEIKSLLAEQARRSSDEPGCVRFEVYHSQADKQHFILVEQWETQEDLNRHKQAKAFTELYIPKVTFVSSDVPNTFSMPFKANESETLW